MATIDLGAKVRDKLTGVTGVLLCKQIWHDRTDEWAIQRPGLDADGEPFALLWFPAMRIVEA